MFVECMDVRGGGGGRRRFYSMISFDVPSLIADRIWYAVAVNCKILHSKTMYRFPFFFVDNEPFVMVDHPPLNEFKLCAIAIWCEWTRPNECLVKYSIWFDWTRIIGFSFIKHFGVCVCVSVAICFLSLLPFSFRFNCIHFHPYRMWYIQCSVSVSFAIHYFFFVYSLYWHILSLSFFIGICLRVCKFQCVHCGQNAQLHQHPLRQNFAPTHPNARSFTRQLALLQ